MPGRTRGLDPGPTRRQKRYIWCQKLLLNLYLSLAYFFTVTMIDNGNTQTHGEVLETNDTRSDELSPVEGASGGSVTLPYSHGRPSRKGGIRRRQTLLEHLQALEEDVSRLIKIKEREIEELESTISSGESDYERLDSKGVPNHVTDRRTDSSNGGSPMILTESGGKIWVPIQSTPGDVLGEGSYGWDTPFKMPWSDESQWRIVSPERDMNGHGVNGYGGARQKEGVSYGVTQARDSQKPQSVSFVENQHGVSQQCDTSGHQPWSITAL